MTLIGRRASIGKTRSLTAFFDTHAKVQQARTDVVAAGVSSEAVKVADGQGTTTGNSAAPPRRGLNFLDTVRHAFGQDQRPRAATESRRGFVLTAHVPEASALQVLAILDREGTRALG